INVTRDPQIIPNPHRVDLVQPDGIAQVLDSSAADRPRRCVTTDDDRGDAGLNLVDQSLGEEGCVYLSSTLYEHTQDAAAAELIEQGPESHPPVRGLVQDQSLGLAYRSGTRRRDQRVRPDHL